MKMSMQMLWLIYNARSEEGWSTSRPTPQAFLHRYYTIEYSCYYYDSIQNSMGNITGKVFFSLYWFIRNLPWLDLIYLLVLGVCTSTLENIYKCEMQFDWDKRKNIILTSMWLGWFHHLIFFLNMDKFKATLCRLWLILRFSSMKVVVWKTCSPWFCWGQTVNNNISMWEFIRI